MRVGHCAKCGSEEIDYQGSDLEGEQMYYRYSCKSCDHEGKEWYKLEYTTTD